MTLLKQKKLHIQKNHASYVLTMLGLLFCHVVGAASERVSSADFGENWPLKVKGGVLNCELIYEYEIVTFTTNGKTYAVNGLARGNRAKKRGWLDVDKIWKTDPRDSELKINIGPLIDRGRALCGR